MLVQQVDNPEMGEFAVRGIAFLRPDGTEMYIRICLHRVIFGWRVWGICKEKGDNNPIPDRAWNICLGTSLGGLNIVYNVVHGKILEHLNDIRRTGVLPQFPEFSIRPVPESPEWAKFLESHMRYMNIPDRLIIITDKELQEYRTMF